MENNNKESFKLLGVSASDTDSGSEVPEFVAPPPRKKRVKRRLRGASSRDRQTRSCNCKGRTVGLSLASVLLFCWLMTVSWLAIVLHGELKRLDVNVRNGKKMKKRKELDALVAHSVPGKRVGGGGHKRGCSSGGGASSQDQLLTESTDEQDDYWSAAGGGGGGGKERGSGSSVGVGGGVGGPRCRFLLRRRVCGSLLRACTAVLVFACVVATTTVMWLFIDIREQVTSLRTELDQVVAGSQGVQDTLQKCHSLSRELQQNQTALFHHLANLTLQLHNFSQQLLLVQGRLQDVEEGLKAAPELVTVPRDLKALTNSVASFGSQIRDLNSTVATLKNDNAQLHDTSKSLFETISSMNRTVVQLEVAAQQPSSPTKENSEEREEILRNIAHISANVSAVNDTLNKKLQWLQEDQQKDHKSIGGLQDMNQNVSARLTTLEGECVKTAALNVLNDTVIRLAEKVKNSENKYLGLDDKVADLQMQTKQLDSNATQRSIEMRELGQAVSRINQFLHHPPVKQAEVSSEPPRPTQGADTQTTAP